MDCDSENTPRICKILRGKTQLSAAVILKRRSCYFMEMSFVNYYTNDFLYITTRDDSDMTFTIVKAFLSKCFEYIFF